MNRKVLLTFTLLTAGMFAGCAGNGYYVVRSAPPPPRVVGFVGSAPGPGFVWIDGYWARRGNDWNWVGGSWVRPPRPHAVWVRSEWRHEGNRYRFYKGHWR